MASSQTPHAVRTAPPASSPTRRLASVAHVAQVLDCSQDTVMRMVARGDLPAIDIGTGRPKTRIDLDDLDRFIARRTRRAPLHTAAPEAERSAS